MAFQSRMLRSVIRVTFSCRKPSAAPPTGDRAECCRFGVQALRVNSKPLMMSARLFIAAFGSGPRSCAQATWLIGGACVLRLRGVVEIANSGFWVERYIFNHRAETMRSRVNLGLGLSGQLDALGVAAALEVEHPVWPPAMLIVADEHAGRDRPRALFCRCRRGRRTARRRRPCRHWPSNASASRVVPANRN